MNEEWRSIRGYEGLYDVSNLGNIRSIERLDSRKHKRGGFVLKRMVNRKGYYEVNLCKNGVIKPTPVHKLVMQEFSGDRPIGYDINHKDGNKLNPSFDNLEYVTPGGNVQHAFDNGLNHGRKGEKHHLAKLTNKQADIIREMYGNGGVTQRELGKMFGITQAQIGCIVRRVSYI